MKKFNRMLMAGLLIAQVGTAFAAAERFDPFTFITAAENGDHDVVKNQLKLPGANVNVATSWGYTALMEAAEKGYRNIVKTLLEHGADKTPTNDLGQTAEDLARNRGHEEVANYIRDYVDYMVMKD